MNVLQGKQMSNTAELFQWLADFGPTGIDVTMQMAADETSAVVQPAQFTRVL